MRTQPETSLERELLRDVQDQLDRWAVEFAGQPAVERKKLLLLALEREQIVAVAYREEAVAFGRAAFRMADLAFGRTARLGRARLIPSSGASTSPV